eukprot:gene10907-7565_t
MSSSSTIFLQHDLAPAHRDLVIQLAPPQARLVNCVPEEEGGASSARGTRRHRYSLSPHEIHQDWRKQSVVFVTERHMDSADVVYAVFVAQLPVLSFMREASTAELLTSTADETISAEALTAQFFRTAKDGRFIVIEGADGAGKETQTKHLKERLGEEGVPVGHVAFPNYGGFCGNVVRDVLNQRKALVKDLNTLSLSLMFTLNRLSKRSELLWARRQGRCVLLDRYYTANFGYQGAKVSDADRGPFLDYLERLEVGWLGLPSPHLVVYLDLPPRHALMAMKKDPKRQELDANETASVAVKERIREVFCWGNDSLYPTCIVRFGLWSSRCCSGTTNSRKPKAVVIAEGNSFYVTSLDPHAQTAPCRVRVLLRTSFPKGLKETNKKKIQRKRASLHSYVMAPTYSGEEMQSPVPFKL